MSIIAQKLNADTTFLLTFSTETGDIEAQGIRILLDPWLSGDSSWLHPSFQFSKHTVTPSITTLSDLQDDIDAIIVSQDKSDHCHKETLCSWPRHRRIDIYAAPAAAKKIRDWKYFKADWVHELVSYSATDSTTLRKIQGHGCELTIANLSSRKDITGLHNAIAFTYKRSSQRVFRDVAFNALTPVDTTTNTPPDSPTLLRPPQTLRARIRSYSSLRNVARRPRTPIASPPLTPDDQPSVTCIYSPHGVEASIIEPYMQQYLHNALPLTLLIHSMVTEKNPWFMGGVVATGTPGGIEIVKLLQGRVRHWIAAHDEAKDNRGVSVRLLKTRRYKEQEVHELLAEAGYEHVKLACLDSGDTIKFSG